MGSLKMGKILNVWKITIIKIYGRTQNVLVNRAIVSNNSVRKLIFWIETIQVYINHFNQIMAPLWWQWNSNQKSFFLEFISKQIFTTSQPLSSQFSHWSHAKPSLQRREEYLFFLVCIFDPFSLYFSFLWSLETPSLELTGQSSSTM